MTLEEAVEMLNRERHLGATHWRVSGGGAIAKDCNRECGLTAFEAVAIAEKYERERPSDGVGLEGRFYQGVMRDGELTLSEDVRELRRWNTTNNQVLQAGKSGTDD